MAAVLGARAITFLREQLQPPLHLVKVVLWSDSTTVLQWLRSEHKLPQFVQNRISAIKSVPDVIHRYVATDVNPADLPSRGISASSLQESTLWWSGPPHQSSEDGPEAIPPVNPVDVKRAVPASAVQFEDVSSFPVIDAGAADVDVEHADTECVKSSPVCHVKPEDTTVSNPSPLGIDITRFSSFDLLIRVSALCLRFIARLRKAKSSSGPLSRNELARAEILWIQHVQASKYADVIHSLTKAGRKPDIVQQLNLFLDDSGVIRCKGRLENAELTHQARFPALLPRNHPATNLIIVDCHRKVLHGGVAHTLSRVRYQFWIPQGRAAVKQVLRLCRTCVRWEGGPYRTPAMAPLPSSRVTPANPFSKVGLDYFGPVQLRVDAKTEPSKAWVCLFTCMVTRAVHLELVTDMSSTEFLLAFRRFVARRGTPTLVVSDNAPQFVLAKTTLDLAWEDITHSSDVLTYASSNKIEWQFIVSHSPWMGGFYERTRWDHQTCASQNNRPPATVDVSISDRPRRSGSSRQFSPADLRRRRAEDNLVTSAFSPGHCCYRWLCS